MRTHNKASRLISRSNLELNIDVIEETTRFDDYPFRGMVENNPEFIDEVLKHLAKEKDRSKGSNAVDMLHTAIVRAVEATCDKELESLIRKLEESKVCIKT